MTKHFCGLIANHEGVCFETDVPLPGKQICGAEVILQTIDADHFWYKDVLLDLNLLYYEAVSISNKPEMSGMHCHSLGFELDYLNHVCKSLHRNDGVKFLTIKNVENSIRKLNGFGMHTGVKLQ